MPVLDVCGISVAFPYSPYECQIAFMASAIEAVRTRQNALLESPTGTGKTLCVLCSLLSWQQTVKAALQCHVPIDAVPSSDYDGDVVRAVKGRLEQASNSEAGGQQVPTIYYASRTHAQLAQVVRELKKTAFAPRTAVLGSREQSCVHPKVSKISSNSAQAAICNKLCSQGKCEHKNKVSEVASELSKLALRQRIMDIEELGAFAKRKNACAFFAARDGLESAELVLLPYNYLLDAQLGLSLNLQNAVVVIDEAHNIEGFCTDVFSVEIATDEFTFARSELEHLQKSVGGADEGNVSQASIAAATTLITALHSLFTSVALDSSSSYSGDGGRMVSLLESIGINHSNAQATVNNLNELKSLVLERTFSADKSNTSPSLQNIINFIRAIYGVTPCKEKAKDDLHSERPKVVDAKSFKLHISPADARAPHGPRRVCYWCFNPGLAMRGLCAKGVRSVILTSGTLSPLTSFAADLQIAFNVQLENQHVIDLHQICVAAVKAGPSGVQLSSAFDKRNLDTCKHEIGLTVLRVAQVVPDGLLVFFPSYSVLQACVENWRKKGAGRPSLLDSIGQVKHIVFEPRDRKDMQFEMQRYYALLDDKSSSKKGAIFFSICRGKVSEGLDFADNKGRAVIIAGLPYPPLKDPKVVLKRRYLDEQAVGGKGLKGGEWYNQQSARAVNQAIGRVIRHRHDYGAIVLADSRFADPRVHGLLSKWLRPHVNVYASFAEVEDVLARFFESKRHHAAAPPVESMPSAASAIPLQPEEYRQGKQELQDIPVTDQNTMPHALTNALHALSQQPLATKGAPRPTYSKDLAKGYLERVKAELSNDDYKRFNEVLKQYKAKQVDMDGLLSELSQLFASRHHLLTGFRQFVPNKHVAGFDAFLLKMQRVEGSVAPLDGQCIICKDSARTSFRAPCAHVACFACWSGWLRDKQECPECKGRVRMALLKKYK